MGLSKKVPIVLLSILIVSIVIYVFVHMHASKETFAQQLNEKGVEAVCLGSHRGVCSKNLRIDGTAYLQHIKAHPSSYEQSLPRGWKGGVHAHNVYANNAVGVGSNGTVQASINSAGIVRARQVHGGTGGFDQLNVGKNINMSNGKTIHSKGRLHVHPQERLYLLPKQGVIIGKNWGSKGDLQVDGKTDLKGDLRVRRNTRIDGKLSMKNGQTIASDGRLHVHTGDTLYLLPKKDVIVGRRGSGEAWGGSGNLRVEGKLIGNEVAARSLKSNKGLEVLDANPGPLVEKRYNNSGKDRYGVSQENNGQVYVYGADHHARSSVNLGFATGNKSYNSKLKVHRNGVVEIPDGKLCIGKSCMDESQFKDAAKSLKLSDSIMHPDGTTRISNEGIMFGGPNGRGKELNSAQISAGKHRPNSLNIVGMASGSSPADRKVDVWAEGGMEVIGALKAQKLCIGNTCITEDNLKGAARFETHNVNNNVCIRHGPGTQANPTGRWSLCMQSDGHVTQNRNDDQGRGHFVWGTQKYEKNNNGAPFRAFPDFKNQWKYYKITGAKIDGRGSQITNFNRGLNTNTENHPSNHRPNNTGGNPIIPGGYGDDFDGGGDYFFLTATSPEFTVSQDVSMRFKGEVDDRVYIYLKENGTWRKIGEGAVGACKIRGISGLSVAIPGRKCSNFEYAADLKAGTTYRIQYRFYQHNAGHKIAWDDTGVHPSLISYPK